MSQTPTQRRREIDDARRRTLNGLLEQLAREQPAKRALAEQTAAAIGVLSGDELELLESIVTSIRLASTIRMREALLIGSPVEAVAAVVSRLLRGRASYGELTIDSDPRDWDLEHDEEICDALIYEAIAAMLRRRDRGLGANAALLSPGHLRALSNVGSHVEHSTLAALVRRVQDIERPVPFEIPLPWCLGSAMLFSFGSAVIEGNTIVALRCNHCGREWSLSSTELRITGNGQYVIPTHEAPRQ